MDVLDEEVNALFRQWDEARMRVRLCKQLLQECRHAHAGSNPERFTAELQALQATCDSSLERLIDVMQRRRAPR